MEGNILMNNEQKTLLELRKEAGLMQKAVANKVGVSAKTVQNWESGTVIPNAVHFKRLAKLYGEKMENIYLPI